MELTLKLLYSERNLCGKAVVKFLIYINKKKDE
jgi:hypothetical protein